MKISTLKLFCDVVHAGSFSEVARSRDIDPSKVSRDIRRLEDEIGFPLFERSTRRFKVTESGDVYYQSIKALIDALESAKDLGRDVASTPTGRLKVTASIAFGHVVIAPLLTEFRQRFPKLDIELVLTDSQIDIASEPVDLAVRLGPPPEGHFVRTKLMDTRHHVCVSPAYLRLHGKMKAPNELGERDCVRFPFLGYRSVWKFRHRRGNKIDVPVSGSLIVSNALVLKRCVLDGHGPGLLADWMIKDDVARGDLVTLFKSYEATASSFDTGAWILYKASNYTPKKVRVFVDFLKEKLSG